VRKALTLALCGSALAACSSFPWSSSTPAISLESTPPGAHAALSTFGACKTPCTLPGPEKPGDYTVTFGLAGYAPMTIPIHVEATSVTPNPVTAVLQPTTPARR
jgi:hypothetical protein